MKFASTALRQSSTLAARKPFAGRTAGIGDANSAAPNFATTASTNVVDGMASVTSNAW